MGFSLEGLFKTAAGISPYALTAMHAQQQRENAAEDRRLAMLYRQNVDTRADALNKAQIANLQTKDEGQWDKAEAFTRPDGTTIMASRNKVTGKYHPVTLDDDSSPSAPSAPRVASAIPDSALGMGQPRANTPMPAPAPSMAGVGDSQDMSGGTAASATPQAPQVPQQGTPSASTLTASQSRGLRPYVKPPANPPRDPVADHAANRAYDIAHPLPTKPAADDRVLVQVQDPQDPTRTIYVPRGQAAGMATPTKSSGGSASLSPEDRARMLEQAKLDNATMKAYEQRVMSGQAKVGTLAGVAGATASGSGAGVMGNVMGVLGNAATGAIDPEYQKYITAQRSYGRIMGNLQSKRYTDHQAEIERSISGLQGNDLNGTIQYKQDLRDKSLADVDAHGTPTAAPKSSGRGGGRGSGPPANAPHPPNQHDTPGNINLGGGGAVEQQRHDYDVAAAHLKAQGKDPIAEIGARP